MQSYITRAAARTDATSFLTPHNTAKHHHAALCFAHTMPSGVEIEHSEEIEEVVSGLRVNALRASDVEIPQGRCRVTFNIDQHTELITLIKQTTSKYSHAFGLVHSPGITILSGPYSYTMVIVESTQDLKYTIDRTEPGNGNLIKGHDGGFAIQVESGRLVGMVFAWRL